MLLYGTVAIAVVGLAAWQVAQPEREPVDHEHELRNPDGSWKYTNRLADSTSPYLLQHAHNPVDWYPWGEEALRAARDQDKPIFLSVGYSTCYWCHVMEREVFENPEIAALMNEHFINIKVDREQRPDIDEVYMTATQIMTQRGGWPMSVFLTLDLKPFFAGTYFGPEDQPGRPGFPTLANAMSDAWVNRRGEVEDVSERVITAVRGALLDRLEQAGTAPLTLAIPDSAASRLAASFDERWGGFGVAPKFPQGFNYPFLLAVHERTGDPTALDMTVTSLRLMAAGGMYDHVGGGFHRYSTDGQWKVPHFEKMLYNQAQLTRAYLRAYEAKGEEAFADTVRDILRYVDELMTGPDGELYSALDAETDAAEGAYYVWNRGELTGILGGDDLALFDKVFTLAEVPAFPGHKHPDGGALHMRKPIVQLAADLGMPYQELRAQVDAILAQLKSVRDERKLPHLDDKVIAGWNGLMIGAYAEAGRTLDEPEYTEAAQRAAAFLLERLRDEDGDLLRVWRAGVSEQPAFHEDYAFVIQGLASLYRTTGERKWLDAAADLADRADGLFWDQDGGGYYFAVEAPDLIARSKSASDGAIPSGNSAMANALLDLAELTGEGYWRSRAEETLTTFSGVASGAPRGHLHMVHAIERFLAEPTEASAASGVELPELTDEPTGSSPLDSSAHVALSAEMASATIRPGETFTVRIRLDVAEGWHVNANPASAEFLIATTADVRSALPIEVERIEYPAPKRLRASYAEAPIDVYEGEVEIVATCRLADELEDGVAEGTIRALVAFQACDEQSCLRAAERIVAIPVEVAR